MESAAGESSNITNSTPTQQKTQRAPRRRIRCKMCRQELAGKEQVIQHGSDAEPKSTSEESPGTAGETNAGEETTVAPEQPHLDRSGDPILSNPACSGYFVEPLKWMDHFLSAGEHQGKIVCPNPKCKAKLGNYDWSGVGCGCREWVTPGFCINRSKVDEITIR
ncbi:hypothetical protein D9611_010052 [Ephemerocybe angulata]|uniref:protein-tyrosine-phosphatase n=1 Tax=Ephemerocybe angulata TaxID=980116 RepID=A0A8H5FFY2_9AGAR|nr:hypothetical protein D9611_010052 [Tulosesus angulatus]